MSIVPILTSYMMTRAHRHDYSSNNSENNDYDRHYRSYEDEEDERMEYKAKKTIRSLKDEIEDKDIMISQLRMTINQLVDENYVLTNKLTSLGINVMEVLHNELNTK